MLYVTSNVRRVVGDRRRLWIFEGLRQRDNNRMEEKIKRRGPITTSRYIDY